MAARARIAARIVALKGGSAPAPAYAAPYTPGIAIDGSVRTTNELARMGSLREGRASRTGSLTTGKGIGDADGRRSRPHA